MVGKEIIAILVGVVVFFIIMVGRPADRPAPAPVSYIPFFVADGTALANSTPTLLTHNWSKKTALATMTCAPGLCSISYLSRLPPRFVHGLMCEFNESPTGNALIIGPISEGVVDIKCRTFYFYTLDAKEQGA